MQPRTHKARHGPNSREATTFPFILYFVPLHEAQIRMTFCLGIPKIPIVGTPATLGPHNFVCRPLIEMRSKTKL
jgi:hypothetical protein